MNVDKLKFIYNLCLRRRGLYSFLRRLPSSANILDVGCGNNSPFYIKSNFPEFHYTGIDIGNYNQTKPLLADEYILTDSAGFASAISMHQNKFDAVISSHNLEHCEDRWATLLAMLSAVKWGGGMIYLAFPSSKSVEFPSRSRTLNYFDDPTHRESPPDFEKVISLIESNGFEIDYKVRMYRPLILRLLGFIQEPFARKKNIILQGTWSYYGFESIIWARKKYLNSIFDLN